MQADTFTDLKILFVVFTTNRKQSVLEEKTTFMSRNLHLTSILISTISCCLLLYCITKLQPCNYFKANRKQNNWYV